MLHGKSHKRAVSTYHVLPNFSIHRKSTRCAKYEYSNPMEWVGQYPEYAANPGFMCITTAASALYCLRNPS